MQESPNHTSPLNLRPLQLSGIQSRIIANVNGLDMHVLEAGAETATRGRLLLLHGFPELAYSWRHVMQPLAQAGFHVVAPDQRGYGRTRGWSEDYATDLQPFRLMNLVRDALALIAKLGWTHTDAVIGHDFGSPVAACCALMRPDVFRSVAMMSAPFEGLPRFPTNNLSAEPVTAPDSLTLDAALAELEQPRKHYQHYYCSPEANADMTSAESGLADFLRAYFHYKSADWKGNHPEPLPDWSAESLALMPTYYIMDRDKDMAATVAPYLPSKEQVTRCHWLTDEDLEFYTAEYSRTGFQGGLNWYRCGASVEQANDLHLFSGRTIDVPSCFIAGRQDWGIYQRPGAIDTMQSKACTQMRFVELIDGAGHWVQQEQPHQVVELLINNLLPT